MSKRLPALIVFFVAIYLSLVAGWFSVVGMMALFEASAISVCVMMIGLETAKVVTSCCLKYVEGISNTLRGYLYAAVAVLMVITALGVYGHLAKGHLEATAPVEPIQLQIGQKDARIKQLQEELTRLTTQQNQSNAAVDNILKNSQNSNDARVGLRARSQASGERKEIQTKIDQINTELNTLNQEIVPLKMQISEVSTKLGPIQYVADLFGWSDPEAAVRMIILLLMFAFDPLAIVLMIVGTSMWINAGKNPTTDEDEPEVEPKGEPEAAVDEAEAADEAAGVAESAIRDQPTKSLPEEADTPKEPKELLLSPDLEITESLAMPVIPSPAPSNWGGAIDDATLFAKPNNLLPELEELLAARVNNDAEDLVKLVSDHPELINEVAELLEEQPDLLSEVEKVTEKPDGWLETNNKKTD